MWKDQNQTVKQSNNQCTHFKVASFIQPDMTRSNTTSRGCIARSKCCVNKFHKRNVSYGSSITIWAKINLINYTKITITPYLEQLWKLQFLVVRKVPLVDMQPPPSLESVYPFTKVMFSSVKVSILLSMCLA